MKKMKRMFVAIMVLIMVFSLVACKPDDKGSEQAKTDISSEQTKANTKGVIKIGGLAPITGSYAEFGKGFKYAWETAIEEINAAGGANGYMLSIDVQDSEGDAVISTTMATKFAEDDEIMLILGDFSSTCCLANTDIIDKYGITQLSPTCSSPLFCPASKYNFSINGLTSVEGQFAAKYIVGEYLNGETVVVLRADNDWSEATVKPFVDQCAKENIQVLADEKYQLDETDFSSVITKVRAMNPDVMIILDQGTAVSAICNACDAVGWGIPRINIGATTSQQVADQLVVKNLLTPAAFFFDPNNEPLEAWRVKFRKDTGYEPTSHSVQARDTVYLLKQAIEKVGDGEITRDALCNALQGMEMDGFTGKIIFNPDGDITRRAFNICGVGEDSLWYVVKKVEFDPADFG